VFIMNFPDPGLRKANKLNNTASDLAVDKKLLLANSAHNTLSDLSSLANQVFKGSHSSTTLSNTHRAFASLDSTIDSTSTNITKLSTLLHQLNSQEQVIRKTVKKNRKLYDHS
jgi:hypothetical protein